MISSKVWVKSSSGNLALNSKRINNGKDWNNPENKPWKKLVSEKPKIFKKLQSTNPMFKT